MTTVDDYTEGETMGNKDKKPHESMNADQFLAHIHGHHDDSHDNYIENRAKRAEAMHDLLEWYFRPSIQGKFQEEITKPFDELDLRKYDTVHQKIEDAHKDRVKRGAKKLTKHQADNLLKELVDKLLPDANVGVQGNADANYDHFNLMLKELKNYLGEEEADSLVKRLYGALQEGRGYEASCHIVDILRKYHHGKYMNDLVGGITNPNDKEFVDEYASHLERLVRTKTGKPVVKQHLATNIIKAAQQAARGSYAEMLREYEPEPKATPKAKGGRH